MAVFEYKGLDRGGKAISGLIDADSPKVARLKLRKQGLFPMEVKVQAKGGKATTGSGFNLEIDVGKYFQFVSAKDVAILTRQLATLLGASVPMADALNALVDQTEKPKLKIIMSEIKQAVNEGSTLADAMKQHPRVFDGLYVHMIRAGERAGALPEVLRRLADFGESKVRLQGKLFGALAYPVLLMIIGAVIMLGLFVGVVPRMRNVFKGMPGGEDALPIITKAVFAVGDFMISFWMILIVIALVGGAVGFFLWTRSPTGRPRWDGFKLWVPIFGRVNRLLGVSRFCRTLSTLLVSGVPILTAMSIVKEVVGNVKLTAAIDNASKNIEEGQSIAVPLRRSGQFPAMVTHMIAIGEKTGELDSMLTVVADSYERDVEVTTEALTALLTPIMMVIMGAVVLVFALALLLPMQSMTQSLMR